LAGGVRGCFSVAETALAIAIDIGEMPLIEIGKGFRI
jgi:hypothetical protein